MMAINYTTVLLGLLILEQVLLERKRGWGGGGGGQNWGARPSLVGGTD